MTPNVWFFSIRSPYFSLYTVVSMVQEFLLSSIDKRKKSSARKIYCEKDWAFSAVICIPSFQLFTPKLYVQISFKK